MERSHLLAITQFYQSLGIWYSALWNARHYGKCFTILSFSGQSAVSILYFGGEPPPPISNSWVTYSGAASHGVLYF